MSPRGRFDERVLAGLDEPVRRYFRHALADGTPIGAPNCVLPGEGVTWRAEAHDHIVARFDLAPERPEVHLRMDEHGAVRLVSSLRWGRVGRGDFEQIPFGAEVLAETRFDGLLLPSRLIVAWWFGTARAAPFFKARLRGASALEGLAGLG